MRGKGQMLKANGVNVENGMGCNAGETEPCSLENLGGLGLETKGMKMKIDFGSVDNIEDLRAVPPGEYECKVAEVRESQSPSGHVRWGLRWEVVAGEMVGKTACWDSLHWSERGLPRAKYVLQVLGMEVEGCVSMEPSELEGKVALVQIAPEEREDPVTGIRRCMNRVPFAGYQPLAKNAEKSAAKKEKE